MQVDAAEEDAAVDELSLLIPDASTEGLREALRRCGMDVNAAAVELLCLESPRGSPPRGSRNF